MFNLLFLFFNINYDHFIVSDLTMEKNSGWSSTNFLLVIAEVTSVGILEPTLPTFCASIINATVNLYPMNWLQKMKTMLRQPRLNRLKNNAQQRLQWVFPLFYWIPKMAFWKVMLDRANYCCHMGQNGSPTLLVAQKAISISCIQNSDWMYARGTSNVC